MPRPKFGSVNDSPSPTLSQETPSPSSLTTPERKKEKVELVLEDGTRQIIDIEEMNGNKKKNKTPGREQRPSGANLALKVNGDASGGNVTITTGILRADVGEKYILGVTI